MAADEDDEADADCWCRRGDVAACVEIDLARILYILADAGVETCVEITVSISTRGPTATPPAGVASIVEVDETMFILAKAP